MNHRALLGIFVFGALGCGAENLEDIGVAREALGIGNGTDFKNKLTANPSGSFTLTADIDMGGAALQVSSFNGVLDGAGHTIKNVTQLLASTSGNAGIFGLLQGATVKNLKLSNVNFKAQLAGGLASNCFSVTIQNVSVQGKVVAGQDAGGICGGVSGSTISGSSASGTVTSLNGSAGGLVGYSGLDRGGRSVSITSSSVASMTVSGVGPSGGLMGFCQDATIERVAVSANVSGQQTAGGICGEMDGGHVYNSYAKGTGASPNVTSASGPAGGLVGTSGTGFLFNPSDSIDISRCYSQYSNVNGGTYGGGILGSGVDAHVLDIYAVGNVSGVAQVGGLAGRMDSVDHGWTLRNGVFRGQVTDRFGPWAGVLGAGNDPNSGPANYFETNLFDASDTDPYLNFSPSAQKPATATQLKAPTTTPGTPSSVYCFNNPNSNDPNRCADNAFPAESWAANGSAEYHTLLNIPGPNPQPK